MKNRLWIKVLVPVLIVAVIAAIWFARHGADGTNTPVPTEALLADVNKRAEDMFFRLVKQMAEREGVTEKLKADNQMEWVARMNNIRSRATEIVNHDIIYN